MGPIYAMGGQPGATTCIDGRGVGQPARRAATHTPCPRLPGLAASRTSHPRSLEVGRGVHLPRYGPLVVTGRRGEG